MEEMSTFNPTLAPQKATVRLRKPPEDALAASYVLGALIDAYESGNGRSEILGKPVANKRGNI